MNSQDYDFVRNTTLLFFLDRLIEKGQPRSLHDLSCQFGTKGFTKEMRQIAGGSQAGLLKFLSQYPSIFTIHGDNVNVTDFSNGPSNSDNNGRGTRNYAQEATDYFVNKLRQYGPGTEVPIKSLLGHRSQAPPEVRHISGQHVKEFHDFLASFPDVFIVTDEVIMLVEDEGKEHHPYIEVEQPKVDEQLTRDLLEFLQTCISLNGPTITDQLFSNVTSYFGYEKWSTLFKTPQDLSTFIKMYSDKFSVHSNLVTLVPVKDRQQQLPKPPIKRPTPPQSLTSPPASLPTTSTPSFQQQTLKQRVGNILMKTIAQNTEQTRNVYNCVQNNSQNNNPQHLTSPHSIQNNIPSPTTSYPDQAIIQRNLQNVRIVVNTKECRSIVAAILESGAPVGVDAEGVNLGPSGPMTMLQVCTWSGQVYLFDLLANRDLMGEGELGRLLQSEQVVKVVHDCRNDSAALFHQHGVTLRNVFDTQAAHAILQQQETGKPVYKVKSVSLVTLCRMYDAPVNPQKEHIKKVYRRDQKFWARRPLTEDMIVYAAFDVMALVPKIYDVMSREMDPALQELFRDLCEEQVTMYIHQDDVKLKKKQRKVETEVADLREKLDKTAAGKNLVLSNREIRLLRYVELTEEQREKLEKSYKVAKKLERLQQKREDGEAGDDQEVSLPWEALDSEYPSLSSMTSMTSMASNNSVESGGRTSGESSTAESTGGVLSPRNITSPTISQSMAMVNEVLSNGSLGRLERIHRLEEVLSAATGGAEVPAAPVETRTVGVQTLSTGEVVITKLYDGFADPN